MRENGKQPTVVRTKQGLSVAGTRVTLYDIMDYVRADWPPTLIRQWLNLSQRQITDVMAYLKTHRDEVEAEYEQVLKQAKANREYWEARNRERLSRIAQLPPKPGQEAAIEKLRARKAELLRS